MIRRFFRRPILALSLAGLTTAGAVAVAQQIGELSLELKFRQFDKNHDGKLTADELPPALMSRLDLNKDGIVTLDEAREALRGTVDKADPAPLANMVFERFDKNHDGKVTREEAGNPPWFDRLDRNKDGVITRDEVVAAAGLIREAMRAGAADLYPPPSEPVKPVANGPRMLRAGDVGVGRQVPDVTFTDLSGKTSKLSELTRDKGLVVAFTSTTCPVSKRYAPALSRLEKELREKGLHMLFVDPMKSEPEAGMKEAGFTSPYVHDSKGALVAALDARTTTEVFLLDASRTLLYRGALDDQYGLSYNLDAPQQRYLAEAVVDMLAGLHPHVAATEAPGCELDRPAKNNVAATTKVTYHRDVARILAQNCVQCHHESGIAPFALDNADEVSDRARTIRRVVSDGTMPPWFAKDDKPGRWANDHSLSARDKADLLAWIDSTDRPMGDTADAPRPLVFPKGGWMYGEPDAVFAFAKAQPVKAEGKMPYVTVTVPTNLAEDRWVQSIEVQPGQRQVVHHVIVFAVDPKQPGARLAQHETFFAAYVPGNSGDLFPTGFAKKLPAGAVLHFQMHYTPNGKAVEDITKIAFRWAAQTPKYEIKVMSVPNLKIKIPPGAPAHEEVAQRPAFEDMNLVGFMPHMHVRGKAFRYEVVQAGGNQTVLDIPRYDFNWQLMYKLNEPLHVPRGTVLKVTATYDNSAANKANPDPTKTVHWGPQTEDEMMIGYMAYYVPVASTATASR